MALIAWLDRTLASALRAFVIAAMVIILVLITLGVVARIVPVFSMSGYDEIIEWLVAWMTFAGTIALWRQGLLFRIDLTVFLPSAAVRRLLDVLARVLMLAFAVIFTWKGWEFAVESVETTPFLFLSKTSWYASMPICGAFMIVYALLDTGRAVRGRRPPIETPP